jgi:hypothetical protein
MPLSLCGNPAFCFTKRSSADPADVWDSCAAVLSRTSAAAVYVLLALHICSVHSRLCVCSCSSLTSDLHSSRSSAEHYHLAASLFQSREEERLILFGVAMMVCRVCTCGPVARKVLKIDPTSLGGGVVSRESRVPQSWRRFSTAAPHQKSLTHSHPSVWASVAFATLELRAKRSTVSPQARRQGVCAWGSVS